MMDKYLHKNYSKKQNSKFPQTVLKISNQLRYFYIYDLQMTEMGDVYKILSESLWGRGKIRDVGMAGRIVLRWNIT